MSSDRRLLIARIFALVLVIAISLYVFSIRDRAEELAVYGYPGIFLISIMANATVLLPAPGVALVFALGGVFPPLGIALAAGAGAALGELSGYLAGFSGQPILQNTDRYHRLVNWMETHKRHSYITIAVLAFIPNPFFDLAGISAGALKIPLIPFLFWVLVGKTFKMLLFAYAGASSFSWILD
jgi:membrane protein YqaA with SNARE-associated domain